MSRENLVDMLSKVQSAKEELPNVVLAASRTDTTDLICRSSGREFPAQPLLVSLAPRLSNHPSSESADPCPVG